MGVLPNNLKNFINNPLIFIFGLFNYYSSSLLGYASWFDGKIPLTFYTIIGIFVFIFNCYGVVLFFKTELNKKTWFPLLMIGYTFFVFVLAQIGRFSADSFWLANSWYIVHTKLSLCGCILIYTYYFNSLQTKNKAIKVNLHTAPWIIIIAIILCGQIYGNLCDWKRAPYVQKFVENMVKYYYMDKNEIPVDKDGNTPLLNKLDLTVRAIHLFKQYHLSVYSFSNKYYQEYLLTNMPVTATSLNSARLQKGWYNFENGSIWMAKESTMQINTGSSCLLTVKAHLSENFYPNGITIFINNKQVYKAHIDSSEVSFQLELKELIPNTQVELKICMDKAFIPKQMGWNEDQRELGLFVQDISFN